MFSKLTENYRPCKWANDNNYYSSRLLLCPDGGKIDRVMDARFYVSGTGATTWCRVWLRLGGAVYGYGVGKATGWGYDRESTAFVEALSDMGINKEELMEKSGITGGIGMSAVMRILPTLLPDGGNLVELYTGA